MVHVAIVCQKANVVSGIHCPMFSETDLVPADVEAWIERTVTDNGWVRDGEKYFCPQHNPAITGEIITVGPAYVELAPGFFVRTPNAKPYPLELEVRRSAPIDRDQMSPSDYTYRVPDFAPGFFEKLEAECEPDEPNARVRAAAKRFDEIVERR